MDWESHLVKRLVKLKWTSMAVNAFALAVAVSDFAICIWIRFDLDFADWIRSIEWYSYWNSVYVVMAGVAAAILTTLFQCYAVVQESTSKLSASNVFFVLAAITEFAGIVCICVFGLEGSDLLVEQLREVFNGLVYASTYDPAATRALNMVQEYVGCCGSTGSDDYNSALKAVPNECRDPVTGLEYPYGCSQQFAWWLEPWTCAVAGLTSGLVLLHIAQIIIGTGIKNKLKDYFYHFDNDSYLGDVDANSYF